MRHLTPALPLLALAVGTIAFAEKSDMYHVFMRGDPEEMQLARQVRLTLLTLPEYGIFDDLEFQMDGVTVTLFGQVRRPSLKEAADNAVRQIKEITQVTNNVEVLPASPSDEQLRHAVYDRIFEEPKLSISYGYRALPPIHIIVKNAQVRLEGLVNNQADKDFIAERVKSTPGIKSVANNLQIRS